jgi:hypothetical protein
MRCRLFSHRQAQVGSIRSGTSDPFGTAARHMVWRRSVQLQELVKDIPLFSYYCVCFILHLAFIITTSAFVYVVLYVQLDKSCWTRASHDWHPRDEIDSVADSTCMLCLSLYRSSIVLPLRRVFSHSIMSQVRDLTAPARSDPPSSSGASTPLGSESNPNSKSAGVCVHNGL